MALRKQKGQGLVEFALLLPLLLILLLGIIEASRVVWSYVTVQTAAREAARYAVTGKPYIHPEDINNKGSICQTVEGEQYIADSDGNFADEPWLCDEEDRREAIKEVALERGRTLAIEAECDTPGLYISCETLPGAFGVRVTGQLISPTVSLTMPVTQIDHPGTEGLNVRVETYYNVTMWDPIFDAIMGGSTIHLRGEVQLQNEGLEAALAGNPPESITVSKIISGTGASGVGPNGEEIWSVSGYTVLQGDDILVHLENHFQPIGPYDVYLGNAAVTKQICANIATNSGNWAEPSCTVDAVAVPPGFYDLYSTQSGNATTIATSPVQVEVKAPFNPQLTITGGDVWAANSPIEINLIAHQAPDEPFNMYFQYGTGEQELIASGIVAGASVDWASVANVSTCPPGGSPCTIQTRTALSDTFYAETDIYVNQPEIVLAGGNKTFYPGETMFIFLRGHTPGKEYDLQLKGTGGVSATQYLGASVPADKAGSTTEALLWTVPDGWPAGTFEITSHPLENPANMTDANVIGKLENVKIVIPTDAAGNEIPYITIDGGYTWPIDSYINIKVNKHLANTTHYLEFGPWRVPTANANDTFDTGDTGSAIQGYTIPVDAVTDGLTKTFEIASFVYATDEISATREITVFPTPVIRVLEGDTVLPDATITIEISNHSPDTPYEIIYANKVLFSILTDPTGYGKQTYSILDLPKDPPPDLTNPTNYGVLFDMVSKQVLQPKAVVATTQLAIMPADLEITNIELPPGTIEVNSTVPVTLTIANNNAVTISRYFDIDYYLDPSPLVPEFGGLGTRAFPGDVKQWRSALAPNSSFVTSADLFVGEYGQHTVYGYADTSDFVFSEPNETNNIDFVDFSVSCDAYVTDNFDALTGWSTELYGNGGTSGSASLSSDSNKRLQLYSDGGSTYQTDDNNTSGHLYFYKTNTITTSLGMDLIVKIHKAPTNNTWAKVGFSVRNGINSTSDKIEYSLSRHSDNSLHRVQVNYRQAGTLYNGRDDTTVSLNGNDGNNPVWLRMQREAGSDTFNFSYYDPSGDPSIVMPAEGDWTPYDSITVPLNDAVYVGFFQSTYSNNNYFTSQLDNFSILDPSLCPVAQGQPEQELPPGLRLCYHPVETPGFEGVDWEQSWGREPNVSRVSTPKNSGFFSLLAPTFDSNFRNPYFYQKIQMPGWILSNTTTIDLSTYKYVDQLNSEDSHDKFEVALLTGPSLASTIVATSTTPIASGDGTDKVWNFKSIALQAASGINLEDYENQELYLYFYNNTNATAKSATGNCPPATSECGTTKFYFDDVDLTICTEQPLPDNITTHLTGKATLFLSTGSQRVSGVNIWAYSEGGDLYETMTIQNGAFNFYNLPASSAGTKYFIYAEYNIVDAQDPTQIATLTGQTTVLLKSSNVDGNPLVTALNLY